VDNQRVDLLIAKIKSGELDAYGTLDKFVGLLTTNGGVPKTAKSLLEQEPEHLEQPAEAYVS